MKNNNDKEVSRRNMWSGILFGVGLIAFIDETVFHQLLRWHHFYDKSTTDVGLITDGIFHGIAKLGKLNKAHLNTQENAGAYQKDQHPGSPGNSIHKIDKFCQSHSHFLYFPSSNVYYNPFITLMQESIACMNI